MENGIYTRRDFKVTLFEKKGAVPLAVVVNELYANESVLLSGNEAKKLILAIVNCLDGLEKGS